MGCDIHIEVERQRPDGTWENLKPWRKDATFREGYAHFWYRHYALFAFLAQVRGEGPTPPRGTPADVSPETHKEHFEWGDDFHSKTWYDALELCRSDALLAINADFYDFVCECQERARGSRVRLIIAFDN